jgi:hypothetical protein
LLVGGCPYGVLVTVPAAGPDPESLEIIHAELDRRQAACEARWNAIDTKAGLLLAAAGVLIAINADKPSVFIVVAELLAAGAGAAAIRSMFPRKGSDINPATLLDDFYMKPAAETRQVLIRGRLDVLTEDEGAIKNKSKWFKRAAFLLAASGVFVVAHTAVNLGSSDPEGSKTTPQTATARPARQHDPTIRTSPALSVTSVSMTASPTGSGPLGGATSGRPTDQEDPRP